MDITPHTSPRKPAYPILLATVAAGTLLVQAAAQEAQVIKGGKRRISPPEQVEVKAPGADSRKVTPPQQADTEKQPSSRQEGQPVIGRARIREPKAPQNP